MDNIMQGFPVELDLSALKGLSKKKIMNQVRQITKDSFYCHKFNERRFNNPTGFIKWELFLYQISLHLISLDNIPIDQQEFTEISSNILLRDVIKQSATTFPCYWLDKNLLSAFEKTDLPDVMGMKRSHKYGVIFLPKGEVRSPDGKNVEWIMFSHILKDEELSVKTALGQTIATKPCSEDILQIFTIIGEDLGDDCYFSGCSLSKTDENKMPYRKRELAEESDKFIDKLQSIVLQCLLWLQIYKPKESIPAGIGFKSPLPNSPSPLNPRWIGKDYQPKIISETTASKINGKHDYHNRKSPTPHERRGHWRSQRVGKGLSHIRTIWIEPHLVGEICHIDNSGQN